ncbi:hypothetical protein ABZX51_006703 [Aspergillus tubingensis]
MIPSDPPNVYTPSLPTLRRPPTITPRIRPEPIYKPHTVIWIFRFAVSCRYARYALRDAGVHERHAIPCAGGEADSGAEFVGCG